MSDRRMRALQISGDTAEGQAAGAAPNYGGLRALPRVLSWLPGYSRSLVRHAAVRRVRRLWVAVADHFEPQWLRPSPDVAAARVAVWRVRWPQIARRHWDSRGRQPIYGFFYPEEEYRPELLEPLAELTREGIADVEVHIHHDGDGEAAFVDRMAAFLTALHNRHGLLRKRDGRLTFGFIHGNWALDNSRPDGRWCGLNNEIALLRDLGCYADFTLPSAPSPCQTGPVNLIYRATDDPLKPRSHARGSAVRRGVWPAGDLTLIPGPLGLNWEGRPPWRPRLEAGEIAANYDVSAARVRGWMRLAPRVGEDAFLKLYTHGAQERNSVALLHGLLDRLFDCLKAECAASAVELHYASPWTMYRVVEMVGRHGADPGRALPPEF